MRGKLSDEGKRTLSQRMIQKHQERECTIIGESIDRTCWRIYWDNNSPNSIGTYHKSFIEVLP